MEPASFAKNPALQRLGAITRQYEALRHANYFPAAVKSRLKVPGDEFTLNQTTDGKWQFRPAQYLKHKCASVTGELETWRVTNRFGAQPLQARIEALMSAESYGASNGVTVAAFEAPQEFPDRAAAPGVQASLEPSSDKVKAGAVSGCFTASNSRDSRRGSWAKLGKTFSPPLNLRAQQALGLWVLGDGQGEVLNVQVQCPEHVVGGIGEHYVVVDFSGWRYFELIEPEGERYADYAWPYGGPYEIYRESVDFGQVAKLSLWYNHLPPGGQAACYLSPIRAVPLVKAKLRNLRLIVGGKTVVFPVELESGSHLEFRSLADCKLYGPDGALLKEVKPEGDVPVLASGENQVAFGCEGPLGVNPRARVTLITIGPPM